MPEEPIIPLVIAVRTVGPNNHELMIGTGDHKCIVWKLTPSQVRKLAIESVRAAYMD